MTTAIAQPALTFKNRREWLQARPRFIGASESASIFGVGYADTNAVTVWDKKTNPPLIEQEATDKRLIVGDIIEPVIIQLLEMETGLTVKRDSFTVRLHPEHEFIGATLDGETEDDDGPAVVECKNVDYFQYRQWQDGKVPLKFNVQVQHQMAVTGYSKAYLVALVGGNNPIVLEVERNDRFIDALLPRLCEFWDYVQRREMPPLDHTYATAKVLAKLHPRDNGKAVPLSNELSGCVKAMRWAKAHMKICKQIEEEAKNRIKASLGDNTYGVLPDGTVFSWKHQSNKGYYVEPKEFRVLRELSKLPKTAELIEDQRHESDRAITKRKKSYRNERNRLFDSMNEPRCMWCGCQLSKATCTLEHVVPLSRGGVDRPENWGLACEECNNARGDLE